MSRTPETYIDKPRRSVHDTLTALSSLSALLALMALLLGNGALFFWALMAAIMFGWIASKIKYTWKKYIEGGGYRLD